MRIDAYTNALFLLRPQVTIDLQSFRKLCTWVVFGSALPFWSSLLVLRGLVDITSLVFHFNVARCVCLVVLGVGEAGVRGAKFNAKARDFVIGSLLASR